MSTSPEAEKGMTPEERFDVLWNEYQYRHEHCWKKLVFQLTGAVVALAIVPYLNPDVAKALGYRIL